MEQRMVNTWRMTVNEKRWLRIDGQRPFDYRKLEIKFGKDEGSAEVHLGQTHVMAFVTAQLVQPSFWFMIIKSNVKNKCYID